LCDQARLRGHGGGGVFAQVHSSFGRRRQRWLDRHGHHGRGALQRKCQRHLDDAGDCARSVADLARGHAGASWSPAQAILEEYWSALAAFCSTEPGGSANAAAPSPGEGVRTVAEREGDNWIINGRKKWVSSATGWDRKGADVLCVVCRTDVNAPPEKAISVIAVERPAPGIVFERAIDSVGHRAHLTPLFSFENVSTPRKNLLGEEGNGLALAAASFTGTAALVGILGVALMRAAFEFALHFARTERRGGIQPIIEHQAVGYALADAKIGIEAARYLSWRACHAVDTQSPAADELAIQAKSTAPKRRFVSSSI